ncbi:UNKNOWN [Stylonychia lemnae]|uniref:Uncharacterized protein n=1 Tax=Stylonychia lemnae TaxID=5949 RepID=A0A078AT43_STYLE|nr:UNKNOWN [Stylonychia lemnae]|eukprot:CDW84043.1 UNKNOWN [Stylonychia lemnae]
MDKKDIMRQYTSAKGASASKKSFSVNIPGLDTLKKNLEKTSTKQVVDLVLFSAGIYLMYRFGKSVADSLDSQMPTEKSMMDMMKQMQGPPGMPPAPM